jgi:hypothetical protein
MKKLVPIAIVLALVVAIISVLAAKPPGGREKQGEQVDNAQPGDELQPAEKPAGQPVVPVKPPEQQVAAAGKSKPKPLDDHVVKGIAYLVGQQHEDGGWGQGGGWRQAPMNNKTGKAGGRVEGKDVADPSDVGNTAIVMLVLLRAGNSPQAGEYAANLRRGLDYLYDHIESADKESLYVTDVRDTQLQSKIGPYVDTFLATWTLSEIKGTLPPGTTDSRLLAALDKAVGKIERHQKDDGTFVGNSAWASVLSQGLCGYALNCASQNGVKVKEETLKRDFQLAMNGLDVAQKKFADASSYSGTRMHAGAITAGGTAMSVKAGTSSLASNAGIDLYQHSSQSVQLSENFRSNATFYDEASKKLKDPKSSDAEKKEARQTLKYRDTQEQALTAANAANIARLSDKKFVAGFGNNGGEEFLSYMNISVSLRTKGGEEWQKWDKQVTENLDRVQNGDGSWSGDHCITGRTFCTSTALLTLMADRAPLDAVALGKPAKSK